MKADLSGTLQLVKEMGFRTVETGAFQDLSAAKSKALLDEFGLKAVSTGASFEELADSKKLKTVIENAKIFGSEYVVCFWIPHTSDHFSNADIEKAVKVFNKAGKALKKQGLQLLYHPHGYEFRSYSEGMLMFDYLAQKTKAQFFNFEMDIYWISNPGQDPVALMQKYPGRWKALHLKDQQKGTSGNKNGHSNDEWNVVVGTGTQDMPAVMQEARKQGIRYYFLEDESSRSVEQVPQSAAFVVPLLND